MTDIVFSDRQTSAVRATPNTLLLVIKATIGVAREWRRRYRSRCELASYAYYERSDLGFAAELDAEIAKPFWRK